MSMELDRIDRPIPEKRAEENMIGDVDKLVATVEYIAVCDHPEILEEDEEGGAEND